MPEWLPHERFAEQEFLDRIRGKFELFGFQPIETRSVEPIDTLVQKGETDKEIYVLRRIHDDSKESDKSEAGKDEAGLGLHFDLTIPLARYVVQNYNELQFPFRRYQIQKVWRGERPQEGRFREFYQCDIDIIGRDKLSPTFDAELPRLMIDVFASLNLNETVIGLNNRKLAEGIYLAVGAKDPQKILRIVDKLPKIGADTTKKLLVAEGLSGEQADLCLKASAIRGQSKTLGSAISALGLKHPLIEEGLNELLEVLDQLSDVPSVYADLSIARGLDYYTGTVYEGFIKGFEKWGAICSGGRYDSLASLKNGSIKLPGVGMSLGLTRLLSLLFSKNKISISRKFPTCVLVALAGVEDRAQANATAVVLRSRGISAEVHFEASKFGKQIEYASKRSIPYVWFPKAESGRPEVRDIRKGEQVVADATTWMPPDEDLRPRVDIL